MIVDLILRLFLVFIAFVVSMAVAAIMLFFTLQGPLAAVGRTASQAMAEPDDWEAGLDQVLTLFEVIAKLIGGFTLTAALIPAVILIAAGEIMHIRSWMYYVLGGGVSLGLAAAVQGLDFGLLDMALPGFALSLVSSGFAAGAIYWLLTGRRAGVRFS